MTISSKNTMGSNNRRLAANRFSPLDTDLGFQHTAEGMSQDVYEPESRLRSPVVLSPARNVLGSPSKYRDRAAYANDLSGFQSRSVALNPSSIGPLRYSLEFLLELGRNPTRQQDIPSIPILPGRDIQHHDAGPDVGPEYAAACDEPRMSLDVPEEPIRNGTFPYARLPFELRQMVLRELVPTKSIFNGTSFPKSCPGKHQQAYFEKTKYLQNRALAR